MNNKKSVFNNLCLYLDDKKYDKDVCQFVLDTFMSLREHYHEYAGFDTEVIDYDLFVKRYVDLFKSVKEFIVIRDINTNEDFLNHVRPIKGVDVSTGYIKDDKGHFIVTNNKPKYYCSLNGLKIASDINILFDETTKQYPETLKETFIHELTHIYQKGFELPWYIMNRSYFAKILREGNAIRESRFVAQKRSNFYTIPFGYNKIENKFKTSGDIEYNIYKYLYFKFQILLGVDFMNNWAITPEDDTFIFKVRKILDEKYGAGTFKNLYVNVELILLSLNNFKDDELKNIIDEQKNMLSIYANSKNILQDDSIEEHERITNLLCDVDLFNDEYEKEKRSLLNARDFIINHSAKNEHCTSNIDRKIQSHTKENYRLNLEQLRIGLEEEIGVREDSRCFKTIVSCNISACEEAIINHNYLTKAVVALESLMIKCLSKTVDDESLPSAESSKKFTNYMYNMGVKYLDYKVMNNVERMVNLLSVKVFLKNHPETATKNEVIATK